MYKYLFTMHYNIQHHPVVLKSVIVYTSSFVKCFCKAKKYVNSIICKKILFYEKRSLFGNL